jgi:branched-subunit amino acid transport protein AzlD
MGIIVMGAVTTFVVLYWYGLVFSNKKPSAWLKISLKILPIVLLALLAVNVGGAFSSIAHYVVLAVFCFVLLAILIFYSVVSVKLFKQLHNKNLNVAKSEKASQSTQLLQKRIMACAIMLIILLCNAICYVAIGLINFQSLAIVYAYQMTRLGNYVYASAAITIQISFFNVHFKPKSSSGSAGNKSTDALPSPRQGSASTNDIEP